MPHAEALTLDQLCQTVTSYYPDANVALLRKAYQFAEKAHSTQKRSSGDPYIIHPLAVSFTLAQMKLDLASIITGLLHDTVEDTQVTLEVIEKEFGKDVSELVDGVTKLNKMTFHTTEERQAENFRKMVIAMARDIRVILVKLADRLNNMQTLEYLKPNKQKEIAKETLEIYAPIANRLGIGWLKIELEDMALRYLHPDVYYRLAELISQSKQERQEYIDKVCEHILEKLKDYEIKAQVSGRAKHFHSVWKKMERRKVDFEQIFDLVAFRIIVDNITECYKALGVIHAAFKPVPGRFKDYIAMPKSNSYQSLHTTVIGPFGERLEIQIRTQEMNQVAERGIAAHWKYKEGKFEAGKKENLSWVNQLVEWQKDLSDPNEFLETVKIDLFDEDVFVFTPRGEVKQLPFGSTPLDFAYAIHTDVGHKCIGAKVNGRLVPLKHKLKSGDTLEVLTSTSQTPSKDWLKIVKTSRAKAKIRAFIKQIERDKATQLGRELLERDFKTAELNLNKFQKGDELPRIAQELGFRGIQELFISIGYGRINAVDVVQKLISKEDFEAKFVKPDQKDGPLKKIFKVARHRSESRNAVTVADLDDVLIRFARCCSPLPGDSIVGFITRGRGVTVHTSNCPKAIDLDKDRGVEVRWNIQHDGRYKRHIKIKVLSLDEPGLLANMTKRIAGIGVNISQATARAMRDKKAITLFDLEVSDSEQLSKIIGALEGERGVISVERVHS